MTSIDYLKKRKNAERMLRKFGYDPDKERTAFLRTYVSEGPDPDDPWDVGSTNPNDIPIACVVVDYTTSDRQNSAIQADDKRVLFLPTEEADQDLEVDDSYKLVLGSNEIEIIRISPIAPAGTVVLYDAQIRR